MPLVYHLKPKNLVGDFLYPLNHLREHLPAVYEQHVAKYSGREQMLERRIPILECFWNDVLFFSPLHPQLIRDAYLEVGKAWIPAQWYEIDTAAYGFHTSNTVIYEPDMRRESRDFTIATDRVMPFDAMRLTKLDKMPQANIDYYREATQRNERILLWRGLTHVLHKGVIALEQARLFEL
jgi:hypothetical protein